ncbi:MAG: hypothetical protein JNM62_08125 [Flavobacteriales bacterium]|nr:hypothetical protein [Flavobacteriales bacterium]
MRRTLLPFLLLVLAYCTAGVANACTAFKITREGRTIVGNNEDAWSINAQVRFEQGHDGGYGVVYFGHFNGHPLRSMVDQLGMNEAGLVLDGLSIQPKSAPAIAGKKQVPFDELMPMVLRSCADVHQAAAILRTTDNSWLTQSMLFLTDRNGEYLIVEADTLIFGNADTYAVGNWRMSSCTDPDAIPIPRLQAGRALLTDGTTTSIAQGTAVLERMKACRTKLGEGTLFSVLFDTQLLQAHLYFYHDFSEVITFNLKDELAKGDRTVAMAPLFGARPEYDALVGYITPFHVRWLFWALVAWLGLAVLVGVVCAVLFLVRAVRCMLRKPAGRLMPIVLLGLTCLVMVLITGSLLMKEGVYYFGLGDVEPFVAWSPLVLIALLALLAWSWRHGPRWSMVGGALLLLPYVFLLGYWGMLIP